MKITLKTVIIIVLIICKSVSGKPCINRKYNIDSSLSSYSVTIVEWKMNFLAVVTPPSIYRGWFTQKMLWEDKFAPVNIRIFGCWHKRENKEINNG